GALKQQQSFLTDTQQKQDQLFSNFMQQHQAVMATLGERRQQEQQEQMALLENMRRQHEIQLEQHKALVEGMSRQHELQLKQQQVQLAHTEAKLAKLEEQL